MYTMQEFKQEVFNYLKELYPHTFIIYETVNSEEAFVLDDFKTDENGNSAGPIIYLRKLYKIYFNCMDFEEIKSLIREQLDLNIPLNGLLDMVTTNLYSNLRVRVTKGNFEQVDDYCVKEFLSLKLLLVVEGDWDDSIKTLKVRRDTLDRIFNKNEEELWKIAFENTINDKVLFSNLSGILSELDNMFFKDDYFATSIALKDVKENREKCKEYAENVINSSTDTNYLFLLTRENKTYGANVLLNTEILSVLSDAFSCNIYILPSSIHEVFIVPEKINGYKHCNATTLQNIVKEANKYEVKKEEVLSDDVFYFDRKENKVKVITD